MGAHDGHRDRLRNSFLTHGLDTFNEINALELLLFYAIPRRDTNELAHELIKHFGSIDKVFEADFSELKEVPGIGDNAAALIMLMPQLAKFCRLVKTKNMRCMKTSSQVAEYLIPRYMNETDEIFYLLCFNGKRELLACAELGHGDVTSVDISTRKIVEYALKYKAYSVVISHNHPHSSTTPSNEDVTFTRKIKESLRSMNIYLDDHIIVSGNDYLSFRESQFLSGYIF